MTNATVLVVEDDVALLNGLTDALEMAGYTVLAASGGTEALELLGQETADIVISDIVMPGMDGYELFHEVRANPAYTTVPFVFLTARSERADVRAGMRVGADDYITKPFDQAELLEAVASRLRRRDELADARRAAYERLAGQMVSTLNHELRAPLAQLSAFAELLEAGGPELSPEELDNLVQGMHGGVSRLSHVVADVALLADIRSGRARATFDRRSRKLGDLPMTLHHVAAVFRQQASDAGFPIVIESPSVLPDVVGDDVYLRDALGRLVDNAIKFSDKPGQQVTIRAESDRSLVRISIEDRGIGIPAHRQASLFDPMRQIDRDTREQQGLGNGLAICHALIELHDGRIEVDSEVGAGSTFVVVLPAFGARPDVR